MKISMACRRIDLTQGMKDYIQEVKTGTFPAPEHKYKFTGDKEEFEAFLAEYRETIEL